jgi:hypothetical protein
MASAKSATATHRSSMYCESFIFRYSPHR